MHVFLCYLFIIVLQLRPEFVGLSFGITVTMNLTIVALYSRFQSPIQVDAFGFLDT